MPAPQQPQELTLQRAIARTSYATIVSNGTSRMTLWKQGVPEIELAHVMYRMGDSEDRRLDTGSPHWPRPEVFAGRGHYLVSWQEVTVSRPRRVVTFAAVIRDDGSVVERHEIEGFAGAWWDGDGFVVTPGGYPEFPVVAVADGRIWLLDPEREDAPPMNGGNQWHLHELSLENIGRRRPAGAR